MLSIIIFTLSELFLLYCFIIFISSKVLQTFLQTQGLTVFPDESPGYWLMGVSIWNVLFEQTALGDKVGKIQTLV